MASVSLWRLYRPDALVVFNNPLIKSRLSWYYMVMNDQAPAKFHIAARLEANDDYASMSIDELWGLHDKLGETFDKVWGEHKERPNVSIIKDPLPKSSFLDVKVELVKRIIRNCTLCERRCGIDRTKRKGACMLDLRPRVASYFIHLGEEAPLVPSGTIFFTGCNLRCVYCQNWDISQKPENGVEVNEADLASMQIELRISEARNINWVGGEPTPNLHVIIPSMRILAEKGVNVPQLWNSNLYLTIEGMKLILHLIDIWLPDFKYGNDECALRYSVAPRYVEVVSRNLKMICDRDEDVIIRHLVLPGHVECCTKPILNWVTHNCPRAVVNIMNQYHPDYLVPRLSRYRELNRRVTGSELREAYGYAERMGIVRID
ncbi:radical SAM protein [Caldivirga sp.]|uniref:radical SAM protein n=1 Tax=Caldivirga sp. TaxID=2080243 RepID=UPI003D0C3160